MTLKSEEHWISHATSGWVPRFGYIPPPLDSSMPPAASLHLGKREHGVKMILACSPILSLLTEALRFLSTTNEVKGIKGGLFFPHKDLRWKEPAGCEVHFLVFGDNNILIITSE